VSLGDFLLAPVCPIEKVTLWEGFVSLRPGSDSDEGAAKHTVFSRAGNKTRESEFQAKYTFNLALHFTLLG